MIEKRATAHVHGPKRGNFRGGEPKLTAKVTPQSHGNHSEGTKQTSTHAPEPNIQRHAQLVGIAPAGIDCLALCTIEGEKRIHLEVTYISGQLVHPQKRRLPTLHREPR